MDEKAVYKSHHHESVSIMVFMLSHGVTQELMISLQWPDLFRPLPAVALAKACSLIPEVKMIVS